MSQLEKVWKWAEEKRHSKKLPYAQDLETETDYKERWRSIYVIYFTMFLISLGFSIILTGVWPYLDKLDPTAGKEFMGYIVAANPFAQMIFSPLVGWWSNRLGSIRLPLLISLAIFTFASAMYSSLELFTSHRKYWMLWSRFLVGVSSANIAACRSYLSAATTYSERTKAVSMISLFQVLGFIVGPVLQVFVVRLGDEGIWLIPQRLRLNMYTASGWINVFLAVLNFCLFLPAVFKEHRIAAREAMVKQGVKTEEETWKGLKPDYLATWTLIVAFFVIVFNFMLLETLGTSVTMDQFAWTKAEALYYIGLLMFAGAVISCICFAAINSLCKYFREVDVMIWCGFLFMVMGRAVYIPWGDGPPQMYNDEDRLKLINFTKIICDSTSNYANSTSIYINNEVMTCNNATELVGCPSSQEWCTYTRSMTLFQFILGYFLTTVGYPIGVTLIQTIFSKILGPRPQGVWMGFMTGSGCLSRVMGPVFVTYVYTELGTNWTFGMTTVMMVLMTTWLLWFRNRMEVEEFCKKIENKGAGTELEEANNLVVR